MNRHVGGIARIGSFAWLGLLSAWCFAQEPARLLPNGHSRFKEPSGDAASEPPTHFPIPPGTVFQEHVVRIGESAAAVEASAAPAVGRLIYSNTMGWTAANAGTTLIADDIATTAPNGCKLAQFAFDVTGRVNPEREGGPFNIDFALYDTCPGAVSTSVRPTRIITGTSGSISFLDHGPHTVVVVLTPPVAIPNQLWLGLTSSRTNAGPIVGTPAQEGFSQDVYHTTAFWCQTGLAPSFPEGPYAGFNVRMWAAPDESCAPIHQGYLAHGEAGVIYNPGAEHWAVDDLTLLRDDCTLIGYDVTIRGPGAYQFELRETCDGPAMLGTERTHQPWSSSGTRVLRFALDPPLALPQTLYFAAKVSNSVGGVVTADEGASIGTSDDSFLIRNLSGQCEPRNVLVGRDDALSVTLLCQGAAPTGACCDMLVKECVGGANHSRPCGRYTQCGDDSTCEPMCRVLPEANCTFPLRGFTLGPKWVEGATCDPQPFAHRCGEFACCTPQDTCEDLTEKQCNAIEPVDRPRQWRLGKFCEEAADRCPYSACLAGEGHCAVPHTGPGCGENDCCTAVCDIDPICCSVQWDDVCVGIVADLATYPCGTPPPNGACWTTNSAWGAMQVAANSRTLVSNATAGSFDPATCCYNEVPPRCAEGPRQGELCTGSIDCPLGDCDSRQTVRGSIWFKFVATRPAAQLSMANADSRGDTIFQVFVPQDSSSDEAACNSLVPIGCADDCEECGEFSKHGRLCLTGLTPGQTYYVMVGSKRAAESGIIRLDITSDDDCPDEIPWNNDDCNGNGFPDGCDLATGRDEDCDKNSVPDQCDLEAETAFDCDGDFLPDHCEPPIQALVHPDPGFRFGYAVAIDGDFAFVSEPSIAPDSHIGQVHLFHHQQDWSHAGGVASPNAIAGDEFGIVLAVTSEWLVLGAPMEAPHGAVYVYARRGADLIESAKLLPSAPAREFGRRLAANADSIAVSGRVDQNGVTVYVFRRGPDGWREDVRLHPQAGLVADASYTALAMSGDWLAVATEPISMFRRGQTEWTESTVITDSYFRSVGTSLDLQSDTLVALDCTTIDYTQEVLRSFRRIGRIWVQEHLVTTGAKCNQPGSIALHGSQVAILSLESFSPRVLLFQRSEGIWNPTSTVYVKLPTSYSTWLSSLDLEDNRVAVGAFLISAPSVGVFSILTVPSGDCDANGRPDACELRNRLDFDCNGNQVPDQCDELAPFDADFDGDVDLHDAAGFANCASARAAGLKACCGVFDAAPPDSTVDLSDLRAFVAALGGPW